MRVSVGFSEELPGHFQVVATGVEGVGLIRATGRLSDEGEVLLETLQLTGDPDITSDTLRAVSIGAVRDEVIRQLQGEPERADFRVRLFEEYRDAREVFEGTSHLEWFEELERSAKVGADLGRETAASMRSHPRRVGRPRLSEAFLRRIAARYLELTSDGERKVIQRLTEELRQYPEHADRSPHTVSTWVRRAREEGWLSGGVQGRAGARPGPRFEAWLKEWREKT